jgi:hypothetical protein
MRKINVEAHTNHVWQQCEKRAAAAAGAATAAKD